MPNDTGEGERRKNGGLSDEQVEAIREAILKSIYEDIGRSVVKKMLWLGGIVVVTALAWFGLTGKLPPTP